MKKLTKYYKEKSKPFDEKKSVIPKWLLERGEGPTSWEGYDSKEYLEIRLTDAEKEYDKFKVLFKYIKSKLDKNSYKHFYKEFGWKLRSSNDEVKRLKKQIKEFTITYFNANDVEKIFKDIFDKYELADKKITRPRPQNIGKKHNTNE